MQLSLVIGALFCLVGVPADALARGTAVYHDDPLDPFHIDQLPPDIRSELVQMCPTGPRAGHYFATYLNGGQLVRLHFEYLQCERHTEFHVGGNCLRKDFIAFGAHYRLLKSYYAKCEQ